MISTALPAYILWFTDEPFSIPTVFVVVTPGNVYVE